MTTVTPTRMNTAILSVWTLASGRGLVRFRAHRTVDNPSGIEVAYTPLLSTLEGQAIGRALRLHERSGPLSLLRTTPVEISFESLPDGSTMRIISPVKSGGQGKMSARASR